LVVRVCITVDVERRKGFTTFDGIDSDLSKILDALRPHCKATFFVAGEVAENAPEAVRWISREGHEVSCHGLLHERFDTLEPSEQLRRIELATRHISKAAGSRPLGFRAPEHRANAATIAALEQLEYEYDSSVLPRTPFMRPQAYRKWRFLFAPSSPYYPSRTNLSQQGNSTVVELPVSTCALPFMSSLSIRSGSVSDIIASLLVHRGKPVIYYLHSYDSSRDNGKLVWLRRVIRTLHRPEVEFITMHQLAVRYRDEERRM
jgi:hypothetical protein